MLTYRDLILTLRELGLGQHSRVIFHASLSALGPISGGAETVVGALISTCELVLAPTFTYRTMVVPEVGPPDNGLEYGAGADRSRMA
jgi:aminoglycoside 3-N-acetyltransferase